MGSHTNSTMMFSGCLLLAVSVSAFPQPQLEELKNTLTSVFGGGSDDDYEKVPYEVLGKYEGYEMRKYPSVNWACTKLTYQMEDQEESGFSSLFAERKPQNKMFMKLFGYITGANTKDASIDMTSPVLSLMKPGAGNMMTKEMCFYLDKAHQLNPPKPTDPKVTIETNKEFTVYVHIRWIRNEGQCQHEEGSAVLRDTEHCRGGSGLL